MSSCPHKSRSLPLVDHTAGDSGTVSTGEADCWGNVAGVDGQDSLSGRTSRLSPLPVREWSLPWQEVIAPKVFRELVRSAKGHLAQTDHT